VNLVNDKSLESKHARTPQTDEVLRRVGRNVVNFQEVESLLKHLNAHSSIHAPASQILEQMQKQEATVHRVTMGELANRLVPKLQTRDDHEVPEKIDEPWLGFTFSVEMDAEFIDLHDQEMAALVNSRNDLVHHFLPRWIAAAKGDTESALAYLDAQMEETFRMRDRLRAWVNTMNETRRQAAVYLTSPDGVRELTLSLLKSSRLVAILGEIALRKARADGWTYLTTADHLIRKMVPTELTDLHERFGVRNLKGVLLAVEYFEVLEEALSNGGTRTLYRISDRYELKLPQCS
jgi:hypothetical protein